MKAASHHFLKAGPPKLPKNKIDTTNKPWTAVCPNGREPFGGENETVKFEGHVTGLLNLANRDGVLFKKTLICRTGKFKAMYGIIDVTAEMLSRVAEKYNKSHAAPLNQNDFAPILVDHNRAVDLVKGRVLADLELADWQDPGTGVVEKGLYGTLRVDDAEAQQKVEKGVYAQVSMSFDDENDELYEVSFVAVEAARRSQVLSEGENKMDLEKKLAALEKKHKTLQGALQAGKAVRAAASLAAGENLSASQAEVEALGVEIKKIQETIKTAGLRNQFKGFIREGKLNKAEFDKVKFEELAALPTVALTAVLDSYKNRAVSTDVTPIGQTGAKPIDTKNLSAEQTRAVIKAQKEGKSINLEANPENDDDKNKGKEKSTEASGEGSGVDDMSDALKSLEEMGPRIAKALEHFKKMSDELKKLSQPVKGEDDKETEE